jgi:hypothetical protein
MCSRYILSLNVLDHTSSFWITAFNEVAEQIMGVSANELMRLKVNYTFDLEHTTRAPADPV